MKRTRLLLASGFSILLILGLAATRGDAQPGTLKKIADGVWFREGEIQTLGHCNNAIIEMKDYLIVVDANFPSGARAAMEDANKVSKKPVKYVFDTHHHGDHLYGNAVWTKQGAITLAYQGVAEELKRYEPGRWRDTAKSRKDVGELKLKTAEAPKQTFSQSPFLLKDETRTAEFYFFGWAHTRGDGFLWLPKEKVLCTGDAAVNGPYNYTADGNIGNWPRVMDAAMKLNPAHVLPGHGPAGGAEILSGQKAFMEELMKAAKSGAKTVPDSVKNWVGDGLGRQLADAATEAKSGKAVGEIAHK